MTETEYDSLYYHFKNTGEFDANILQEYLYEVGKSFDINQFFHILNILENPFAQLNADLQRYTGINYKLIMINKCFEHFDRKFNKSHFNLHFSEVTDERLLKTLTQKYPQQIIYF